MGSTSSAPSRERKSAQQTQRKLCDEYVLGEVLGEGAFGAVRSCTRRSDNVQRAVKIYRHGVNRMEVRRELDIVQRLKHTNIVSIHGIFSDKRSPCIVMDKYVGGDLISGLEFQKAAGRKISGQNIAYVCAQMADAIQYLHSLSIMHRDIKADNFLSDRKDITDPDCHIALTDFGTSVVVEPNARRHDVAGTQRCWAPEFFGKDYGFKVDIWAMGVCIYGLLEGRFPFKDENDIRTKDPKWPEQLHPNCENYLKGMLEKCEQTRLSAADVVAHSWIKMHSRKRPQGADQAQTAEVKLDNIWTLSPRECNSAADGASYQKHGKIVHPVPPHPVANQMPLAQKQGQGVRMPIAAYPHVKPGYHSPVLLNSRASPNVAVVAK